jgi:hypothetical protein
MIKQSRIYSLMLRNVQQQQFQQKSNVSITANRRDLNFQCSKCMISQGQISFSLLAHPVPDIRHSLKDN